MFHIREKASVVWYEIWMEILDRKHPKGLHRALDLHHSNTQLYSVTRSTNTKLE